MIEPRDSSYQDIIHSIILYCRAGFEPECSQEFSELSKQFGAGEIISAVAGSGYVVYRFANATQAPECARVLPFSSLCFSRQMIAATDPVGPLSPGNRVAPLVEEAGRLGTHYRDFFLETADTNEAKQLSPLCRKLLHPFEEAMTRQGLLDGDAGENGQRFHVFFTATDRAYAGCSYVNNSSPWPMGIPRLKFPSGAPSRSTLKLEEAFVVFMSAEERARLLKNGMSAVDLGASPGGWTWQFTSRGMRVTAVDNGRISSELLNSGLVRHVPADGFAFAPRAPVDWMVCDIVEQPSRIAKLAAQWIGRQWCRRTIFNLKLPMKKRYEEVKRCGDIIASELQKHGVRYALSIKQLYHDREEVTAYLRGV
jgi:23S rRNA (cytidine2498-2'-O)-methyltransferase